MHPFTYMSIVRKERYGIGCNIGMVSEPASVPMPDANLLDKNSTAPYHSAMIIMQQGTGHTGLLFVRGGRPWM